MNTVTGTSVRGGLGAKGKTPVIIRLNGPVAVVEPAHADLLRPALSFERRTFTEFGGRIALGSTRMRHHKVDGDRLWIPAGSVSRITALLERHGYAVEIVDLTLPRPGVTIDQSVLAKLPEDEASFVRAVVENRRSLIEVPKPVRRVAMIAAAARALPEARITIATVTRDLAQMIHKRLARRVDEPLLLLNRGGYVLSDARLRVGTHAGVDASTSDVIIFPEATDAISAWYIGVPLKEKDTDPDLFLARLQARRDGEYAPVRSLYPDKPMEVHNQHVVGFVGPGLRLGSWARLRLEAWFGPVIHRVAGLESPLAGVQVLVADTPPIFVPAHASSLERKRTTAWYNDSRNAVVVEVAAALATGRNEPLWRHGLLLDGDDLGLGAGVDPLRVAVLVESPEHGRELAMRVSGWPLRDGRRGEGRPGDDDADDLPDRSIVTLLYADRLAKLDVDVLIRADGSSSPLALPGFPPREHGRQGRPVLLVDLGDDGDVETEAATRRRLEDYQRRGWGLIGPGRWTNPAEPALEAVPTRSCGPKSSEGRRRTRNPRK